MKSEIEVGEVQVERLDDIPVIFGHLQKIRIQAIIDQVIKPHGNWQGLSPGWLISIWLVHILSEHTHCMDRVQDWVAKRLYALKENETHFLPKTCRNMVRRQTQSWRMDSKSPDPVRPKLLVVL